VIKTDIKKLDELLRGGIKKGFITDIYGASGTGKTQLAIQITVNTIEKGELVLYHDTTGKFRPERILELLKFRGLESGLLEQVKVARITNTSEQIQSLSRIKQSKASLVIIDSVTDLFSFEYPREEQILEKNVLFMKYMRELSLIAIQNQISVIVTNMVRKINDLEKENLEQSISMFTHLKFRLSKNNSTFLGEIIPSFTKTRNFSYVITKEGLTEFN